MMSDPNDDFGLAALMLASGVLSRLEARGLLVPGETELLIDSAITRLETMPRDEKVDGARVVLENLLAIVRQKRKP
jgi:hypothetical protein